MTGKWLRDVFEEISRSYDLINHVLTWGLDILWRREAARIAAEEGGTRWLDMCAGTGKMARRLLSLAGRGTTVVAADFSLAMMRAAALGRDDRRVHFVAADADAMPFRDGTFDLIALAFGVRNLHTNRQTLVRRLREFPRLLKAGGRFVSVETSRPSSPVFRGLFHLYVRLAVKPIGYLVSGSRRPYEYLAETIRRFYSPEEFQAILTEAGFARVELRSMTFGAVAIHRAGK